MKARRVLACVSLLVIAIPALAQHAPPAPPAHDAVGEYLFPPELVMTHQREIGLRAEQKTYLRGEISQAQGRFTDLQWELQDVMEALHSMLEQERVDEQPVLAQLEKVLAVERQIKRTQMTLMVRIKNNLTPEQQARLRELRPRPPQPPRPPHPPRPPGPAPDLD